MTKIVDIKKYKDQLENQIMTRSLKLGDKLAFDMMKVEPKGTDNTDILYSAFTTILVQLMLRGFTDKELKKDITFYNKIANNIKKEHDK